MRIAVSAIALLACTSLANAADLGGPSYGGSLKDDYVAPVDHRWTGFYIGGNVGHVWGDIKFSDVQYNEDPLNAAKLEPDGWFGGGQIGFNFQSGQFVVGIEADLQGGDISDSLSFDGDPSGRVATDVNYFGSVRGRLGLAADRVMPYVTGGFAWADVDVHAAAHLDPNPASAEDDATHTGWVLGGGVEVALDPNWSVKAEYLYYDLGKENYSLTAVLSPTESHTVSGDADLSFHTFRVGVNYKFGG